MAMMRRFAKYGGVAAALLLSAQGVNAQVMAPQPVQAMAPGLTSAAQPTVVMKNGHAKGDSLEKTNRKLFSLTLTLDRILFGPLAFIYKTILPKPLRTGLRHVVSNLSEPIVFANDVVQLKPKRAVRTFARFAINSTAGIGGIFDVAKPQLPHRNNGFGNTLARYGVGPGPFLFLPFLGPSDLRDALGFGVDGITLPLTVGFPFNRLEYGIPSTLISGLDLRIETATEYRALLEGAADPYAKLRSVYQQNRAAEVEEIRNGQSNVPAFDDPMIDPEANTPTPSVETPKADAPGTPEPTTPDAPLPGIAIDQEGSSANSAGL